MTKERAKHLLSLYVRKRCTPAEQQELSRFILDPLQKGLLDEALMEVWKEFAPMHHLENDSAEQMLTRMLSSENSYNNERKGGILYSWRKWAAAAAILIFTGSAGYIYLENTKVAPAIVKTDAAKRSTIQPEILPGTTKATLTLADGSKILLDTISGNAVAMQGNTRIIKKDGQVIYQKDAAAASKLIYNTLSTERGHQYPLTLSDGTKVLLNAASSIRFPVLFDDSQRSVEISGEAYFEVAKNHRPFTVTVDGTRVQVLGTHFNINAYTDEEKLNTTLLEGSVKITKGPSSILLSPGQQAQVDRKGAINLNRNVDTEEIISWTQGYFHFNNASLETVLRQISRWYDVDVFYEHHSSEETFGGDIQKSLTLSQVLKILDKSQVKFRVEGKRLIVMK